jgi:divalent metal cation (Fe/Co/Zn/Cd) transporter
MLSLKESPASRALGRILRIQVFTVLWMLIEAVVSLAASWKARSPALFAFGGDSAIELVSAAFLLRRFYETSHDTHAEKQAAEWAGALLFALAGLILLESGLALVGGVDARSSRPGTALLLAAGLVMPWLAWEKRKLSIQVGSPALWADAADASVCGYMAWIALAGTLLNAIWDFHWADPLAALAVLPFIVHESWQTMTAGPRRFSS